MTYVLVFMSGAIFGVGMYMLGNIRAIRDLKDLVMWSNEMEEEG